MLLPFLNQFLLYIASEKGLSSATIEAYERDLRAFCTSLNSATDWEKIAQQIVPFLSSLRDKGYASASLARMHISLKVFFRFLKKEGIIPLDFPLFLDHPKIWQLIPEVLTMEEVDSLLKEPPQTALGVRDRAILELLYASGLRVSELCQLNLHDVDEMSVRVLGKGGKERIVPVNRKALDAIDLYLWNFEEKQRRRIRLCLSRKTGREWTVFRSGKGSNGMGKKQAFPNRSHHTPFAILLPPIF